MSAARATLDAADRALINALQEGFPLAERPYAEVGRRLGLGEDQVISHLARLLEEGVLTRFGPMFNAEALGGAVTLAALRVPEADFERIAALVNAFPEVAHNYAREDAFNMWFVVAAGSPARVGEVLADIERASGLEVLDLPRVEEFHLGLRLEA